MKSRHNAPRYLPLFDSPFAAAADTVSQESCDHNIAVERRRTPQILLVDDDPATLLALPETLRLRLGSVVTDTANSADSAVKLLSSTSYDVIVSDIVMPGADGMTVLKEARRLHPDVRVILMTGQGSAQEEAALYGGAYAFLEKPLDVDRFISVVRAALCRTELERRVRERNQASFLNLMASLEDPSQQPR
jgi:two-component system, NtrC family, C4-dicarboxylate transport response regulator DctD